MRLEHYQPEKLKREILAIIGKHLNLKQYKVFFFGSRVTDKSRERSDIDVGIEGSKEVPWHIMAEIKEEIEALPVLYKIDVVDFTKVPPGFRRIAREHTEALTR